MYRKRTHSLLALIIGVSALSLGCGDGDSRTLSLRDAHKPAVDLDAEHARIKQMQMIAVQDLSDPQNPQSKEVDVSQLESFIISSGIQGCQPRFTTDSYPDDSNIANGAAEQLKGELCVARTLQTVASLRAQPLAIGTYVVPPQGAPTNAVLLQAAQAHVVNGLKWFGFFYGLNSGGLEVPVPDDANVPVGQLLAELYADGYSLYEDLAQQRADVILSVADSERGSTANLDLGQARQFAEADLSRAAAAHSLIGGSNGIEGDETTGFCSSPELSAGGQRALKVLRQTGISPALVVAENVSQPDFVDGSKLLVPSGSVRERYKTFVDKSIPDGKRLGEYLGLAVDDFIAARKYLASEIKAFGRSSTVTGRAGGGQAAPAECIASVGFSSAGDLNKFDYVIAPAASWSVTAGTLAHARGQSALAIHKTESLTDGYVEARITSADSDFAGLVLRYLNTSAYYKLAISEQQAVAGLYRISGGTQTTLETIPLQGFDWAAGHTVRFSAQGDHLTATLDGQVILAATDSTWIAGSVGLMSASQITANYDDFAVYSPNRTPACGQTAALPAEFAWYASTGTEPQELNDEYWASIARYASTSNPSVFGEESHPIRTFSDGAPAGGVTNESLAAFIDSSLFLAQDALNQLPSKGLDAATMNKVGAPLLRMLGLGKVDRPGRVVLRAFGSASAGGGSDFGMYVNVYGYPASAGLRLVDSDNLTCATKGTIEGEPCAVAFKYDPPAALPNEDLADFTEASQFTLPVVTGQKLYLVKPIDPSELRPGQFEALVGFEVPSISSGENHVIPITPDISKRAATLLKPSRAWCTYPAVGCDGQPMGDKVKFDARVPLENELTADNNGVESSWRHSLDLAKQAAAEANVLATEYMNAGLDLDRQDEQQQLREAQDRIRFMTRAEGELETIQNVCGTAVETSQFLDLLGLKPPNVSDAVQCTNDSNCYNDLPGIKAQCVAGRCVASAVPLLDDPDAAEKFSRMKACIGQDGNVPMAVMGNAPVCVWRSDKGLCSDDSRGVCPSLAKKFVSDPTGYTCDGTPAAQHLPSGATMLPPITATIGITNNADDNFFRGPCSPIRGLREASLGAPIEDAARRNLLHDLDTFGVFNKEELKKNAIKVAFEARFGNYSAASYAGKVMFETGKDGAPNTTAWPCSPAQATPTTCAASPLMSSCSLDCNATPHSLLCQHADCTDWDARTPINQRLMNAVWTLQGITVGKSAPLNHTFSGDGIAYPDFSQLKLPAKYNLANHTKPFPIAAGEVAGVPVGLGALKEGGAVRRYSTNFRGEAFQSATPTDFWADLRNPGQRLKLTNGGNVFYAIDPLMSVTGREQTNIIRASLGWGDTSAAPSDRLEVWNGVSRYDSPKPGINYFSGTMFQLLAGNGGKMQTFTRLSASDPTPLIDYYAVPNGHSTEYNAYYSASTSPMAERYMNPVADFYPEVDFLVPTLEYSDSNLFDAAELMCEMSRTEDGWVNTLEQTGQCPEAPAAFRDENDIALVRASLMCKAELIRRRSSNVILQRLPKIVMENLLAFNTDRAYPEIGGDMGSAVIKLREALIRFRDRDLDLSSQIALTQTNLDRFFFTVKQIGVRNAQADVTASQANVKASELAVQMELTEFENDHSDWDNILSFGNTVMAGVSTYGVGSVLSVANQINQDDKAETRAGYQQRINDLEKTYWSDEGQKAQLDKQYNNLEKAKTLGDLEYELHRSTLAMNQVMNDMRADVEAIDGDINAVETLVLKVKRSISRLSSFESSEASITPQLRGVLTARLDVSKRRYEAAHQRAVQYAFLAKRSIEQRLGMHLAEMREDLPLVEAPQKWESSLCRSTGVDYDALRAGPGRGGDLAKLADHADPFIGEYVNKLGDVVESYTLRYGFKDAMDEAVVSLRDDIDNVRKDCKVTSPNLLYYTGQLEPIAPVGDSPVPGWAINACTPDPQLGTAGCLVTTVTDGPQVGGLGGQVPSYLLSFVTDSRLGQTLHLDAGTYRLSWYAKPVGAGPAPQAMRVYSITGTELDYSYPLEPAPITDAGSSGWVRQYRGFQVNVPGDYEIAFAKPAGSAALTVAAPFLEDISRSSIGAAHVEELTPSPFQLTTGTRDIYRAICPDTDGQAFRQKYWERGCTKLCEAGLSDECTSGGSQCYWETHFDISQSEIERGQIFSQSGFAKGNFNYRIEGVGINFVGTGLHSCQDTQTPGPCNSAGFVPFSLYQLGPYTVTNHLGRPFEVNLFDGVIEHARGLGIERYLTNPVSSSDRGLLEPYIRQEYEGRPLDGSYRLRVWDAPGLQFSSIEDVQVYLKYRYWTRTN